MHYRLWNKALRQSLCSYNRPIKIDSTIVKKTPAQVYYRPYYRIEKIN